MKSSDVLKLKVHKEGNIFIAGAAGISVLLFMAIEPLGWVGLLATLFCLYFFRDPDRIAPDEKNAMVSPADGVVSAITEAPVPSEIEGVSGNYTRISVFLSVFNVHVNRTPVSGTVDTLRYIPGEFLDAADDNTSEQNERQLIHIKTADKEDVVFAQVAGLVARRILCDLKEGQQVAAGDRMGLIRFGSRTDIYVPDSYQILVKPGQTMIGGETVIARPNS